MQSKHGGGGWWGFFKYLFILFILAAPGLSWGTGDLCCGMQALSCGMHAGSSSLTRDQTRAPCIGSTESYPLDQQGSPLKFAFLREAGSK